ncbi:MAG: EAL domain-containing protein [Parvibaculum sp.]
MNYLKQVRDSLSVRWRVMIPLALLMAVSGGALTAFFLFLFSEYQDTIVSNRAGQVADSVVSVLHAAHETREVDSFIEMLAEEEDVEQLLIVDIGTGIITAGRVDGAKVSHVDGMADRDLSWNVNALRKGILPAGQTISDGEYVLYGQRVICETGQHDRHNDVLVFVRLAKATTTALSSMVVQKLAVSLVVGFTLVMLIVSKLIYDVVLAPLARMKKMALSEIVDMPAMMPYVHRQDEFGALARNILGSFTAATETAQRFARQARVDGLTQLGNRTLLREELPKLLASAEKKKCHASLLIFDLDGFKSINDTYGHDSGDALLIEVAKILQCALGHDALVVRLGGDEFAAVIVGPDSRADAGRCAERVMDELMQPLTLGEVEIYAAVSIGVTTFPEDGREPDLLMKNADLALYRAKAGGRGRMQFYKHEMQLRLIEQASIERDMRVALSEGQFVLYYQPKVDLVTDRISGAEALIRWKHPERGMVPPDRFIPIAEKNGLICNITEWVLLEACRQLRAWIDEGLEPISVAINVSALDLRRPDFTDFVAATLVRTGVSPKYLEIEVTESTMMHDVDHVIGVLRRLRALGVKLSIDDFGTGYSSLAYLKSFPVQRLKIDRSFVMDMTEDRNTHAIPQLIINLARSLGVAVLAEGVETDAQRQLLQGMDCEEAQGYLFGAPVQAASFASRLRSHQTGEEEEDTTSSAVSVA